MGPSIFRADPASAAARRAMVDNQIRTFDVTDQRVLAAFEAVPREPFLPERLADLAYSDAALVVEQQGARRSLCTPMVLARMVQGLDLVTSDRALVVGAGTGYAAAILAALCDTVTALESETGFAAATESNLAAMGHQCRVVHAPLSKGDPSGAPFTAIMICGAVETNLETLLAQLESGGRLVAISTAAHEATRRSGKVVRYDRIGADISSRVLFDATVPVLPEFRLEPAFTF